MSNDYDWAVLICRVTAKAHLKELNKWEEERNEMKWIMK